MNNYGKLRAFRIAVDEETVYWESSVDGFREIHRRYANGDLLVGYRYPDIAPFKSPYISWLNLDHNIIHDSQYLRTAVQQGRKLFSMLCITEDIKEFENIKLRLTMGKTLFVEIPPRFKSVKPIYNLNVVARGSLSTYFDLDSVLSHYELLGLDGSLFDQQKLRTLFNKPIVKLAEEKIYEIASPEGVEELLITGLLLGYPLETTASILNDTLLYDDLDEEE